MFHRHQWGEIGRVFCRGLPVETFAQGSTDEETVLVVDGRQAAEWRALPVPSGSHGPAVESEGLGQCAA